MFSVYTDDPDERCLGDIGLHGLASIKEAQGAAEQHFGGPLHWIDEDGQRGEDPSAAGWFAYIIEEDIVTEQPVDIQTLIQQEIAKAAAGLGGGAAPPQSFEDTLAAVDPADSDAALAMLDFLLKTGRLGRVGVLDGGGGYLFMYQEPKGSTKQGYKPGATQGDRIVDEAVEAQRAAGNAPTKRGMCPNCYSVVKEVEGTLVNEVTNDPICPNSMTGHGIA